MRITTRQTVRFGSVLRRAEDEAADAAHLDVEHLLIGLVADSLERDPDGPLSRSSLGRLDRLREAVATLPSPPRTGSDDRHPPFSTEAKGAVEAAGRLSEQERDDRVGAGHLLRALLTDPSPRTDAVLRAVHGDRDDALADLRIDDTSERPYAVVGPVVDYLDVILDVLRTQSERLTEIERRLGER